jgi:glucosamine-6-phosphate deaminase
MTSTLDPKDLFEWCRIPAGELENHPDAKVRMKVLDTADDVHRYIARGMVDEVKRNNAKGNPTRWILPCGPTKQYSYFVKLVNKEGVSLKNVHIFHMDDFLDWQGRRLPLDHPFSYEGWMRRNFYAPVNPELAVPEAQRHFPDIYAIEAISREIDQAGGIDTMYGGIGYRGHIAYNEPPHSPWYTVTPEEFRASKTRILNLNEDTLIAISQRSVGGCSHAVPPMAITLGMQDLLSSNRIRLISDTGAWKQTVIRVLLFGPITTEYPVTFVQGHRDVEVVVDQATALPPLRVNGF